MGRLNRDSGQAAVSMGGTVIVYEGRAYNSVDELPTEAREKYPTALGRLDRNQNMIPDFLESPAA